MNVRVAFALVTVL